jgi:hypothetical protein
MRAFGPLRLPRFDSQRDQEVCLLKALSEEFNGDNDKDYKKEKAKE